jgi:hypothetical protein
LKQKPYFRGKTMGKSITKFAWHCAVLFCGLFFLAGCVADAARIVPSDFEVVKKRSSSIAVQTVGGSEANPSLTSHISARDYTDALSNSLWKSGAFKCIRDERTADYILAVTITDYDEPVSVFDFNMTIKTTWMVVEPTTRNVVWNETFSTTYTTKIGDVLIGTNRLQEVKQDAARMNIREGIKRLSMAAF